MHDFGIVGHTKVIKELNRRGLPEVALFYGPEGVGKRTLCQGILDYYSAANGYKIESLDVHSAKFMKELCAISSLEGRMFVVDLQGASSAAINDMLKLLEEPPYETYFLLHSSEKVPPVIYSRSSPFFMGNLSQRELHEVLVKHCQLSSSSADAVAHMGTVKKALDLHFSLSQKGKILSILKAASSGDSDLLREAFKMFDQESATLFQVAMHESITGDWKVFEPEELGPFARPFLAEKVLTKIGSYGTVSPSLTIRLAMESFFEGVLIK